MYAILDSRYPRCKPACASKTRRSWPTADQPPGPEAASRAGGLAPQPPELASGERPAQDGAGGRHELLDLDRDAPALLEVDREPIGRPRQHEGGEPRQSRLVPDQHHLLVARPWPERLQRLAGGHSGCERWKLAGGGSALVRRRDDRRRLGRARQRAGQDDAALDAEGTYSPRGHRHPRAAPWREPPCAVVAPGGRVLGDSVAEEIDDHVPVARTRRSTRAARLCRDSSSSTPRRSEARSNLRHRAGNRRRRRPARRPSTRRSAPMASSVAGGSDAVSASSRRRAI